MASFITKLAVLAALVAPIFGAPAPVPHVKLRNPMAAEVLPDSYIVVYHTNINTAMAAAHMDTVASMLSKRDFSSSGIGATYDLDEFKGFQVIADSASISEIANAPEVAYIEKDAKVYASALTTQSGAPYGLGRVSHRNPGTTTYVYDTSAGSGGTVYIVDTGIYAGHSQFGGRARMGANFVSGSANTDENGHGTHCAGTIGSAAYGVAKKVNLVGVKVLDANGQGYNSDVISGIQWVANNAVARSVLSMSLGGTYSSAVNSAVKSTYSKGVTVVVAAGNDNDDASNYSPASEPTAITVGAIDSNDNRASFSNYGNLVDIFGPGVNILSTWIGSTTATNTISGTSMATPHIAGLAAYLIALEGLSSPSAVANRLAALATSGKVVGASGSKNLIGYNGSGS